MKRSVILTMVLVAGMSLLAGCGGDQTEEQAAPAGNAATEAAADPAATVATHDCEGDCGMKAVPEDKMTELHGKWYCAGCAKKAAAEDGHDHG